MPFGLGLSLPIRQILGGGGFSPASLFAAGEIGVWYDPSDFSRYAGDSTLGPELVTNGTFDTDTTGWTVLGSATFVSTSGQGVLTVTSGSYFAGQAVTVTSGKWYEVRANFVTKTAASTAFFRAGTSSIGGTEYFTVSPTVDGTSLVYRVLATTSTMYVAVGVNASGYSSTWDNISVRELTEIDTATLFQDTTGTTPVTAVEQPVGLMLDKSQGLALGNEVVSNGTFNTDTTGWTLTGAGGAANVSGGEVTISALLTDVTFEQVVSTVTGRYYKIEAVRTGGTATDVVFRADGSTTTQIALGTSSHIFIASGSFTAIGVLLRSDNTTVTIDSISVKELKGNHAIAANATTARPVLRNRYQLLTYSQEFDQVIWVTTGVTKSSANTVVAPDGTTTAESITGSGLSGAQRIRYNAAVATGNQVLSFYAKDISHSYVQLIANNDVNVFANFDLSLGAVGTKGSLVSQSSISNAGNGWYRLTMEFSTATAAGNISFYLVDSSSAAFAFPSATSGEVAIWGAQLTTAADDAAINGEYQRIAAAPTVGAAPTYDDNPSKFPVYLYAVTDDAMISPNINFGVPAISVVLGVTKNSDTAFGMIVELSTNAGANDGSFAIAHSFFSGDRSSWGTTLRGTSSFLDEQFRTYVAPSSNVLSFNYSPSAADQVVARIDGVDEAAAVTSGSTSAGNFGNYAIYLFGRSAASLFANVNFYGLIVRSTATTGDDLLNAESWMSNKL